MSEVLLFDRAARLVVAEPIAEDFSTISAKVTEIKDLRIVFQVKKSLSKDPNEAKIVVYNLSEESRASLAGNYAKVALEAGYVGSLALIFVGDARHIESKHNGVEWETTFECGDGERAYNFAHVNASFAPGAKAAQVINTIGKATGLPLGNLAQVASSADGQSGAGFVNGYVAHGPAIRELDKILRARGFDLSIQNGTLQATKRGEPTTETVVVLNAETGLVGAPETATADTKDGKDASKKGPKKSLIKATSLLQPILAPGRRVRLQSALFSGDTRVETIEHSGDTDGNDWVSKLELFKL